MIAKGYMSKWCHEYEIWDPHVLSFRVEALGADRCAADLMSSSMTVLQMILSGKCTPVSQCNKCLFASRSSAPLFNQVLPFKCQRCKWCNTAEPWRDVTFPTLHWRLNDSCRVMRLLRHPKAWAAANAYMQRARLLRLRLQASPTYCESPSHPGLDRHERGCLGWVPW